MTTIATVAKSWTVGELRAALASPDLPDDAIVNLQIDVGDDLIRTWHIGLDLTKDRRYLTVGHA